MVMNTKKGFTLIELTTAIVIMAILGTIAGMGIVQIANCNVFLGQCRRLPADHVSSRVFGSRFLGVIDGV